MSRDLFWTGTMTRIAKQGAVSYEELKRMNVDEFFLILKDYENNAKS
jgi:hypothetical protein